METLDIIILLPLAWGTYKGFTKGFVMELVSLLAFILGIIIAFKFMHLGIDLIRPYLDSDSLLPVASFILIFAAVVIGINFIGKILKKFLDYTLLGNLDDIAGAIVGFLKWSFGLSVILWLMNRAEVGVPDSYTEGSIIFPYLVKYGPYLIDAFSNVVPFGKGIVDSINELIAPLK